MNNEDDIRFPCDRIPEDAAARKLLGVHPQRQEGRWMQRVAVPGGVLTAEQWQTLGRIARDLTPLTPLHMTTRQDVELHDLTDEQIPRAQRRMAKAALTGLGAGGDSLRNITVCPCSGILQAAVDLHSIAEQIREGLQGEEGIRRLPRKFKISFSCGSVCGQPWINDLGFVVGPRQGQYGFRLIGAGSLGAKPRTGIVLSDWLPAADALPAAVTAVRIFAAYGDREHRNRARFRHIRERLGDEAFLALWKRDFEKVRSQRRWPQPTLKRSNGGFASRITLTFPNGDITPEAAEALGRLAAREDIRVRISYHHQVVVFARSKARLQEAVVGCPRLAAFVSSGAAVVACPGTRWCKRALVDTNRVAERIRAELAEKLPPRTSICISGCPNGCAHTAVAPIGLIGQLLSRHGQKTEAFALVVGGGMGQNDRLAKPVDSGLSVDDALTKISRLTPSPSRSS